MTSQQKVDSAMKDLRSVVNNELLSVKARKTARDSISTLQDRDLNMEVKVRKTVEMLDEITSDYDCPPFVRMTFQTVKSKLEGTWR